VRKKKKKKERKIETTAGKYNGLPITMGGHKQSELKQKNTQHAKPKQTHKNKT